MTPTFIGTQQQPWSLWRTNTSLTPCHQGAFLHTGFQGTLTQRLTLESSQSSMMQLFIKKADNQWYVCLECHVCDDPMDHSLRDKQQPQLEVPIQ